MKKFRENGAIGALLDEYEKALVELKDLVMTITQDELKHVVDSSALDKNCRSIQTILAHVVKAGHCYVLEVRKALGETIEFPKPILLESTQAYVHSLNMMFDQNVKLFDDYPSISIEESDPDKKIIVDWGQVYDIEQLFEHAIVHILRHRRQIEKFLIKIKSQ